jgi:hypothetical protein
MAKFAKEEIYANSNNFTRPKETRGFTFLKWSRECERAFPEPRSFST